MRDDPNQSGSAGAADTQDASRLYPAGGGAESSPGGGRARLPEAPRLLVSVRSVEEARVALQSGAEVIDVKEPRAGPLGAASLTVQRAIVDLLSGRGRLLSAALGELDQATTRDPPAAPGVHLAKAGLARQRVRPWQTRLDALRHRLAQGPSPIHLVAVAYADAHTAGAPAVAEVLDYAISRTLPYLLVDTFLKDGTSLLSHIDLKALGRFTERAQSAGVKVALAGALELDAIEAIRTLRPDVIAVRGAACSGGKRGRSIDPTRIRRLLQTCRSRERSVPTPDPRSEDVAEPAP